MPRLAKAVVVTPGSPRGGSGGYVQALVEQLSILHALTVAFFLQLVPYPALYILQGATLHSPYCSPKLMKL